MLILKEKIFLILCSLFENSTTRIVVAIITKFMFSKKATKIDKIFTMDLTLTNSKRQIDRKDFFFQFFVAFLENMNFMRETLSQFFPLIQVLFELMQFDCEDTFVNVKVLY